MLVGFIPCCIIALIIYIKDKHSPFFIEKRVVNNSQEINIVKFRTMVEDSHNFEKYFNAEQLKQWQKEHKVDNDPRITKIGAFLRRTSIDEFPQFIFVFTGKLSTIGPRVITKQELEYFGKDKDKLLSVKPGITGLWQTSSRNESSFDDGTRQKIELEYVDKACLALDTKIFFKTFYTMFIEQKGK